jgi:class 3 adenylate cyclase/tetratricopeptide (TPR) repeat protein
MTPAVCAACGTEQVPGARFCHRCGIPQPGVAESGRRGPAERRVVTVLFGDLSDFTAWAEDLDPERVGGVTDRLLAACARTVTEFGGHVDKLTGDGIMAVFGAPTAHEDDPERAVRAAATMQDVVRRLVAEEVGGGRALGLRVGVNTGEVLAGVQAALSYTVVGDTVNTASRLSDAAGVGGVLVGRETAAATLHAASWRPLPPLRLKGKREPVPAWELMGLRTAPQERVGIGDEAPLVGREEAFGTLVARWLEVVDGGASDTLLVTGEAGVGKTRLAQELIRFSRELPDARMLWGRCSPYGEGRELAPVADWIRTLADIADTDDPERVRERLGRLLARLLPGEDGPARARVGDLLGQLLGLGEAAGAAGRDGVAPVDPQRRDAVADAVRAVLRAAAAELPLLLVVDDLQAAGPATVTLLRGLAQRLPARVLLLGLGRPEILGRSDLVVPEARRLALGPLDDAATAALLRAFLGGAELEPDARESLLGRAQGNPFFLAELLHLLADRGVLRHTDRGWTIAGGLPDDVLPAGVQAVLAARIDSLTPTERAVLRDAAVLGNRFPGSALTSFGHDAGTVAEALTVLVERQFLEVSGTLAGAAAEQLTGLAEPAEHGHDRHRLHRRGRRRSSPSVYRFAHTLSRDVAYSGIPKSDRARRHAVAARWAAAEAPWPAAEVDALLASQVERAARLAREMRLPETDPAFAVRPLGVGALARLGLAALGRDDYTDAVRQLRSSLDLGEGLPVDDLPEDPARLRLALAEALANLHRLDEAAEQLTTPLAAADLRPGALLVLGDVQRRRGEEATARTTLVQALAAASEAGQDRVAGAAMRLLGLLDYYAGRLRAAEEHFRSAQALASGVDDLRGAGWALQNLAWSASTRAAYDLAEEALAEAAEVFTRLGDTGGLSWCAGTEAFVRALQGRLVEARGLAQGLLGVADEQGDRWGLAACQAVVALTAAELGDVAAAQEAAGKAVAGFTAIADGWGRAVAVTAQGVAARAAGRPDEAVRVLATARDEAAAAGHHAVAALATALLGCAHLDAAERAARDGRPDRVQQQLGEAAGCERAARERLVGLEVEPIAYVGVGGLRGALLLARGRTDEAVAALQEVAPAARRGTLLFSRRLLLATYAAALLEADRDEEALAVAREALAIPAEDARSHVAALRVLASASARTGMADAAREALGQAIGVARRTGQDLAAEQVEADLAAWT